jgi:hypothetical protein
MWFTPASIGTAQWHPSTLGRLRRNPTMLKTPLAPAFRATYAPILGISFVLLGVVTASLVLREFFLVTTLSGKDASAYSVLIDAVLIWGSSVVTFAVWYW